MLIGRDACLVTQLSGTRHRLPRADVYQLARQLHPRCSSRSMRCCRQPTEVRIKSKHLGYDPFPATLAVAA
jgi:hypothetical protein